MRALHTIYDGLWSYVAYAAERGALQIALLRGLSRCFVSESYRTFPCPSQLRTPREHLACNQALGIMATVCTPRLYK